jgi:carboxyl-terminal processing protease
MRNKILSTLLLTLSFSCFAQSQINKKETENIATFTKVWGFLKYYHPEVAKGKLDWDKEFTSKVNQAAKLNSKEDISTFYLTWIDGLGKVKECKKCSEDLSKLHTKNLDLSFLYDSTLFSDQLISELDYIRKNRNQGKSYYASHKLLAIELDFSREKKYVDSIFPSEEFRLYALARTWNMFNYFFPYKYLTDKNWNDVLTELIPEFKFAPDTVSYHMSALKLITNLNDSHAANFYSKYIDQHKNHGRYFPPFSGVIIDNKFIVTNFYNDSLAKIDDIQLGDVILKIDGIAIDNIIKTKAEYLPTSNNSTLLRDVSNFLFTGHTESLNITFEREGIIQNKSVSRYKNDSELLDFWPEKPKETYKILEGNIGYINMGTLEKKQVQSVVEELSNTKALIIDIRNYPRGTVYELAKYLSDSKREFVTFTRPNINYPGTYIFIRTKSCGKSNNNPYKGKVILLVNENSQSHAEYTTMGLQTLPNVVTMGSQTAGADGNINYFDYPGMKYGGRYTYYGVYYPDGTETQRVGVKIDIEVKPTIEGIRQGRDEVLEKAIEIANKK